MLRIWEAVVVEGRYDKHTLAGVVDAVIVPTDGFGIFRQRETLALIRRLAEQRGVILLTDPDGAGQVIRGYLKGALPPGRVKQAYVPQISGKERRKRRPGREGALGVEGMSPAVLEQALRRAGATVLGEDTPAVSGAPLTKADLCAAGLAGGPDSAQKRQALLHRLDLPPHLSANALLEVLNALYDEAERRALLSEAAEAGSPPAR